MFSNNNSNQIKHKSDDLKSLNTTEHYWNNFEKKIITPIETKSVDFYDNNQWNKDEISKIFNDYKKKWIIDNYKQIHIINLVQYILMNFKIKNLQEIFNQNIMKDKIEENVTDLNHIFFIINDMAKNEKGDYIEKDEWDTYSDKMKKCKFFKEEFNEFYEYYKKMCSVIYYCSEALMVKSNVLESCNPYHDTTSQDNIHGRLLRKWQEVEDDKEKDHQKLLKCILQICLFKKYYKYRDYIYRPVYTDNNNYTLSCECITEIDKFVYEQISRDRNPMLWDLATKDKSTIPFIQNNLKNCVDGSLPYLEKDRNLFSFNNGIYQLFTEEVDEDGNVYYVDKFYPYEKEARPKTKSGVVSSKYFNQSLDFDEEKDWYDINTENFQKVLDLQFENDKEYDEICKWMYILVGRLLYKIGELDDWQIIPFMKGLAGTGKGTITKVAQQFYDPQDVGVLNNDGEKIFGLSALYDKLLFVAPEIKGDISLPQASFQSMISGEDVSVSIKHQTAKTIKWEIPGILAGNEVPNWTDNSGSIARRLIIFAFNKKVPKSKVDPRLWKKLKDNIPNILRKCNLAYLDAINKYGSKNIWEVLPEYFRKRQNELSEQTNELKKFLKTPIIIYNKNYYISERELIQKFNEYLKENNKRYVYTTEKLCEPFQTLEEEYNTEISIVKIDRRKRKYKKILDNNDDFKGFRGTWIRGLTIQDESTDEINENEGFIDFLKEIEEIQ